MNEIDWHRMPPLSTLRAFEATGRLGGYTAAARSLNVTTAAIAQQVRKLEALIGVALVRRDGRGLALTDTGAELAQSLSMAFAQIATGVEHATAREAARGVRVSTTVRFVDAVILPRLGEFWARNPGTQVSFSPEGNDASLDFDAYDVIVRGGAPDRKWQGAVQTELLRTPFVICAAPGLAAEVGQDLTSAAWIRDDSIGGQIFDDILGGMGLDVASLHLVDPGGAKYELEAARLGYGLHLSPELTVARYLDDRSLVRVQLVPDWTACYFAIHRKGSLSAPVQRFIDWLRAICSELDQAT